MSEDTVVCTGWYSCSGRQGNIHVTTRALDLVCADDNTSTTNPGAKQTCPDSSPTAEMLDVEDFDAVYRGLNYNEGLVQEIQSYRTALGGRTYFERLLVLLQIKGKARHKLTLSKS